MRKLVKIIIAMSLILTLVPVTEAFAMDTKKENISLEEILSKQATKEEIDEVGQKIAEQHNKSSDQTRTGGELWTYVDSELVYSRRAIKGKYRIGVESETNVTYTVTVTLDGTFAYKPTSSIEISVSGGISGSYSKTFRGPSSSEKLSNGKKADERLFIGLTFGEIHKYTYRVTDKYTGAYLRTETVNSVVGAETFGLNQLMCVNSDGSITVGNHDNDAVKTYASLAAYKAALQKYSYTCKDVIYF